MSLRYDFKIPVASTFQSRFRVRKEDGSIWPLSGYSGSLQIFTAENAVLVEMSTDNGNLIITPTDAKLSLFLDLETTTFPIGYYRYSLDLTKNSTQEVWPVLSGYCLKE